MAVPERRARALTRRTGRFGDVKMFGRVAAWSLAGFLVVLPAGPGIETSTIAAADAPAAALATAHPCRDQAGDKIKIQAQKEDQTDTLAKLAALGPHSRPLRRSLRRSRSVLPPCPLTAQLDHARKSLADAGRRHRDAPGDAAVRSRWRRCAAIPTRGFVRRAPGICASFAWLRSYRYFVSAA